ncbi:unnamed protein product [Heligmosomoides polygyrus]|uniref:Reverse transcriptase domain-containing protein n=1 Tax=Heligmosomoides polygyrus TaxID=6339 RepID=A0A183G4G3_HELPZ|nr:unnamed protein product [Heligmosomoides polygyrus]
MRSTTERSKEREEVKIVRKSPLDQFDGDPGRCPAAAIDRAVEWKMNRRFRNGKGCRLSTILIELRDTIFPKLFSAILENVVRELEWEDMGVKVDGRQLHHLRFADDIVLITPSISQAERMLADFDRVCGYTTSCS